MVQGLDQGAGMAAEYATKMATLHEESAARAQADMRKRQERYTLLASLQAQAQVCTLTGAVQQCSSLLFLHNHVMHAELQAELWRVKCVYLVCF